MSSGIVLLDKKAGLSTRHEEAYLKSVFGTSKIGHAGTLDPFATGLVICGVDKGTKALSFLEDKEKEYEATLQLGNTTNTGDLDGTVVESKPFVSHTSEEVENALKSFSGESMQTPPMFSALKIDGVPLYQLARKGEEVERTPRKVKISNVKLLYYDKEKGQISFSMTVSKGTYIRVIGEELAEKLNEKGHLVSLRRTRIGSFKVDDAHTKEFIDPLKDLIPLKDVFSGFEQVILTSEQETRLRHGADVLIPGRNEQFLLLISETGETLAIYQKTDNSYYTPFKEFI
jgi:tRNA pseudouridine55 synthase